MTATSRRGRTNTGTGRAINEIKRRILHGELLPGERLGQETLAAELGVSRVPLREALLVLAYQGLLDHGTKQGFVVARRSRAELAQIYFLLNVLETELLRTLRWPDKKTLQYLKTLNAQMADLVDSTEWLEIVELNHEFHWVLWTLSTQHLISEEVQRIWPLADAYIARGYSRSESRAIAVHYHEDIIKAIVDQDRDALERASSAHRSSTVESAEPTFL